MSIQRRECKHVKVAGSVTKWLVTSAKNRPSPSSPATHFANTRICDESETTKRAQNNFINSVFHRFPPCDDKSIVHARSSPPDNTRTVLVYIVFPLIENGGGGRLKKRKKGEIKTIYTCSSTRGRAFNFQYSARERGKEGLSSLSLQYPFRSR